MSLKDVSKRQWLLLLLILIFACSLRVWYLTDYWSSNPYAVELISDSAIYDSTAGALIRGKFKVQPFYLAPGYSLFLGAIYFIFGHSYLTVYIIQNILGLLNILLIWYLSMRIFSVKTGLVGAFLASLYAPFIFFENKLLATSAGIFLSLLMLALMLEAKNRKPLWFFVAGTICGIAVLFRPNFLIFVPLALFWIATTLKVHKLKGASFFITGVIIFIIPVTLFNWYAGGEIILISSNSGKTFYQGNHRGAPGVFDQPLELSGVYIKNEGMDEKYIAERETGRKMNRGEVNRFWFKKGLSFILNHSFEAFKTELKKTIRFFDSYEHSLNYNMYIESNTPLSFAFLPFSFIFAFCIPAFFSEKVTEDGFRLLVFFAFSIFITTLIFYVSSRYRAPSVPVFMILSAWGILYYLKQAFDEKYLRLCGITLLVLALIVFSSITDERLKKGYLARGLANLANAHYAGGNIQKARQLLSKALKLNPQDINSLNMLAVINEKKGNLDRALKLYKRSLNIVPKQPEVHNNLASLFIDAGNLKKALKHGKKAINLNPYLGNAYNNLSLIYFARDDLKTARKYAQKARKLGVKLHPEYKKKLFSSQK